MHTQKFKVGDEVVDGWDTCRYYTSAYEKLSIGTVIAVQFKETSRTYKASRFRKERTKEYTDYYYTVRWTWGTKKGKISSLTDVQLLSDAVDKRTRYLSEWTKAFDNFCRNLRRM